MVQAMKNDIKNELNKINADDFLKERTRMLVRERAEEKRVRKPLWKLVAIPSVSVVLVGCALLGLFVGGVFDGFKAFDPMSPSYGEVAPDVNTDSVGTPFYKLDEETRLKYRPNWVWNNDTLEYDCDEINNGTLVRDSVTRLFVQPANITPPEGYTWCGYVGLYINAKGDAWEN